MLLVWLIEPYGREFLFSSLSKWWSVDQEASNRMSWAEFSPLGVKKKKRRKRRRKKRGGPKIASCIPHEAGEKESSASMSSSRVKNWVKRSKLERVEKEKSALPFHGLAQTLSRTVHRSVRTLGSIECALLNLCVHARSTDFANHYDSKSPWKLECIVECRDGPTWQPERSNGPHHTDKVITVVDDKSSTFNGRLN